MNIHHTSESDKSCGQCGRPLLWYWEDEDEKNGSLEISFGSNRICKDCKTKNNDGKPPLGLSDLNQIRKRGISKEQYYKEMGY